MNPIEIIKGFMSKGVNPQQIIANMINKDSIKKMKKGVDKRGVVWYYI